MIPVAWEGHAGLLDVKGVGVSPKSRPHLREQLNGLSYLGEVLSDFFTQLLVDAVLAAALPSVTTVPVYAVIDAGFNARFMDGERLGPAGILVRRAHRRPVGNVERPEPGSAVERVKLTIEMLLRAYGITSAIDDGDIMLTADGDSVKVHHGGIEQKLPAAARELLRREVLGDRQQVYFEGVNVQLTRGVQLDPLTAELVDFGQYNVRERFEAPAVCLTYNNPALIGAVLEPDHPAYVQPSPKLRVPFGLWGEAKDWSSLGPPVAFQQPIGPRYRAIAYTLADRIHRGVSDRGDIDRALAELLSPVLS